MKSSVLGTIVLGDITTGAGMSVWFLRDGKQMWAKNGMRVEPGRSAFMNSALCVGAVLYDDNKSQILRFYLDEP